MLDLMVLCWSQSPRDRPSASQIVSIASAPEFTHLSDTVSLNHPEPVVASAVVSLPVIGGKWVLKITITQAQRPNDNISISFFIEQRKKDKEECLFSRH